MRQTNKWFRLMHSYSPRIMVSNIIAVPFYLLKGLRGMQIFANGAVVLVTPCGIATESPRGQGFEGNLNFDIHHHRDSTTHIALEFIHKSSAKTMA